MIIKNANVLCDDFVFRIKDVEFKNGIITRIEDNIDDGQLDASGKKLLPGLVDIHTHGCVGYDCCDGDLDGYAKMSEYYASQGVTSFLFTTMTFSEEILAGILGKTRTFMDSDNNGAYAHGIYMEGPFINPVKKGAQNGKYIIQPDYDTFKRLQNSSGGRIKLAVIAPEIEGAMDCISKMSSKCVVSLAHTNTDYDTAMKAFAAGANNVTHSFNAMPGLNHREPGPVAAALDSGSFMELICDGVHIHPSIIRMMFRLAPNKLVLMSDSMEATGMPDGVYSLGGQTVYINDRKATLKDGTIAGSATSLFDCVRFCISIGIAPELAFKAASYNPCELLGIEHLAGSISVGKSADMVLAEQDYAINKVWIRGKLQ